jgi:transcription initiation factor TFIIB
MSQTQTTQIDACPACEATDIDETVAELDGICTSCGFVIHDSTDVALLDWYGTETNQDESQSADWLSVCRVHNATEQQLAVAFGEIEEIADYLDLPAELRQEVADVYCDAFRTRTTDGRDTASFVAACARLGSIRIEKPIPRGRLTELAEVDNGKFHKSYLAIRDDLELSLTTPEATDYLWLLGTSLSLSSSEIQDTREMLETVTGEPSLVGKDPAGIAAAAVYLTDPDCTQTDVADVAGVSTETIRLRSTQLQTLVSHD